MVRTLFASIVATSCKSNTRAALTGLRRKRSIHNPGTVSGDGNTFTPRSVRIDSMALIASCGVRAIETRLGLVTIEKNSANT